MMLKPDDHPDQQAAARRIFADANKELHEQYEADFVKGLNELFERAWALGMSHATVAHLVEEKLRYEHFMARVME